MTKFTKFNDFDLQRKLTEKGWKGRYYSYDDKVTYLSNDNNIIAEIKYDKLNKLIVSAKFK